MAVALTQKHKLYLTGAGVVLLALVLSAEKDSEASGEDKGSDSGVPCRMIVDADVLNVRSEPSKSGPVVGILSNNQVITAEKKTDNGFRMLSDGRWAHDDYLHEADQADC